MDLLDECIQAHAAALVLVKPLKERKKKRKMLDLFATQITGGITGNKSALTGTTLTGGKSEAQTADFWNFILGQLTDEEFRVDINNKNTQDNVEHKKLKGEKADLALLQLALLGQDVDTDLSQKLADLKIERIVLKQENRIEQLTKLVNHLTNGLPNPPEGGTVEQLVQRLNNRLEKLEASLNAFRSGDFGTEGSPFKLLIATGLNPAQLTEITNRIEEVESKLGRELTVEDLIAGVGNIVPAPGDNDHEFSTPDALDLLLTDKNQTDLDSAENLNENIAEEQKEGTLSENNLQQIVPIPFVTNDTNFKTKPIALPSSLNKISGVDPVEIDIDGQVIIPEEKKAQLKNSEFQELFGNKKINSNSNFSLTERAGNNYGLINAVKAVENNLSGNVPAVFINETTFSSQTSLSQALGFDIQTGTPFTQTAQAAHFISSPTVAGQFHPATKMVAAQIARSANNGDTRAIVLQLDPPELGRVEIRLEFGKEKSVKAHLVVEKPETLLMLQRDASALEKTLQDSGLNTDSGSLNYEMATGDHAFHSGKDNQNTGAGKTGTDLESINEDEILTNMTWDVDPETGHVHYSILA